MMMRIAKKASLVSALILPLIVSISVFAAPIKPEKEETLKARGKTDVAIEQRKESPPGPNRELRILVKKFRITGQTIFDEQELLKLIDGYANKELTLTDIDNATKVISEYFHNKGYLAAYAYLPPQQVIDNTIEIAVLIGQYDEIKMLNRTKLPAAVLAQYIKVKRGDTIKQKELERSILLIDDLPGIEGRVLLHPGREVGTSEMIVAVDKTQRVTGSLMVDNHGNRYTGEKRATLDVTINNPSWQGDKLILRGLNSDKDLDNYQFTYSLPTDHNGGRIGISYSRMTYQLGDEFAGLDAHGDTKIIGINWSFPFVRLANRNLSGFIQYEHKRIRDVLGIDTDNGESHKANNICTLGINSDWRDKSGTGMTVYSVSWSRGNLTLYNALDQLFDEEYKTAGHFNKWAVSGARQKYLSDSLSYHLFMSGQRASKNLNSSEQMSLGGPNGVRAYPQGEAAGDEGLLLNGELRWLLPGTVKKAVNWQFIGFVDNGWIKVHKNPIFETDNTRRLAGAGIGLIASSAKDNSTFRIEYAWRLGSEKALSDPEKDKNGLLWVKAEKHF